MLFGHGDHDEHGAGEKPVAVDEDGHPEPAAKAGKEKKRRKQLTYAAVGLGAVGVAVTVWASKRGGASSSTPSSASDVYGLGQLATGTPAGAGSTAGDVGSSGTDSQFSALEQQIAANNAAQTSASSALSSAIGRLAAELHASPGVDVGARSMLPHLSAGDFASSMPTSSQFDILGSETKAGYKGTNVSGGAPIYALVKRSGVWQWIQGLAPSKAPVGTVYGTPTTFRPYEVPPKPAAPPNTIGGKYPVANPPHA